MDTRIKLKIEHLNYNDRDSVKPSDELYLDLSENVLFSIKESDNVYVTFYFDSDEYSINIEPYDDRDDIIVTPGKRFQLSSGRELQGCYYPGFFTIHIKTKNGNSDYLFSVVPSSLDYEKIIDIRKYVNSFYQGLSNDILRKKKGLDKFEDSDRYSIISDNIRYISNRMPVIINTINMYLKENYIEIEKSQEIARSVQNVNAKTIKWLTYKGMSKNENPSSPGLFLIKKSRPNVNNIQNQIFKRELLFWNNELAKALRTLSNYKNQADTEYKRYEAKIKESEEIINKYNNSKNVSFSVINSTKDRLRGYTDSFNVIQRVIKQYEESIQFLKKYKTNIEYTLFNSWVKGVDTFADIQTAVANAKLKMLLRYRNEYLGIKKVTSSSKEKGTKYAEKCSPKLFETFVYILLISLLIDNGYELIDLDSEKQDLLFLLSNPSKITLFNGELYCDIYYDQELKKSNEKFIESEYCTVSSRHNKPDFILSFRDKNDIIKDSFVVESKWRHYSNIYNADGDTDVVVQLRDYFNLGYHSVQDKKTHRGVISKVIVVFPDLIKKSIQIQENEIIGLGILPGSSIKESEEYQALEKEIFG